MQNNICVGRLTKDIELRYSKENKAICDLNIAVNNGKDDTTFLRITAFDKQAELCGKYLTKGRTIAIKYIIKNNNWEDKEEKKHYDLQFILREISFIDAFKKKENQEEKIEQVEEKIEQIEEQSTNDPFQEFANEIELTDEDLPF